ncbi:MAG: 30S ribosome-binding factor RbfA [Hyphomicrobiales bacterium]|nr:30S ribosome-binding factor RbfA [Hyphomicrobiales bacterium]
MNKPPSQRQLRVGELVRHALSNALARGETRDPALDGVVITVPEVRMSPDLKIATVYVMPLGGGDRGGLVKALARDAKLLRREIAGRVSLKYMPELRFRMDETFDEAARIDRLLDSDTVRRDLDPKES